MPVLKPKRPPPTVFQACLGPAVGEANDFWALAHCPDADAAERASNPDHGEWTYIFRYRMLERQLVARVPKRLDGIWLTNAGTLIAAGDAPGYLEVGSAGPVEVALPDMEGIFSDVWGSADDVLFAVGSLPAFAYRREFGSWSRLALPAETPDLRDVAGFNARDVYFVGDEGAVLHFDGKTVTRLRVPVRRHLTGVARLDDQRVCVSGYQGTLMVGNTVRWRHLATNTHEPLLTVATLDGKAYYCVDDDVWTTDGDTPPEPFLSFSGSWISGLRDALVMSNEDEAKLYVAGTLVDLDVTI